MVYIIGTQKLKKNIFLRNALLNLNMWISILDESPYLFRYIFTVYVTAGSQNKYCTLKDDVSELQLVRRQFLILFFNCAFLLNS